MSTTQLKAILKYISIYLSTSSQAWSSARSGPRLPQGHALAVAPVLLWQVLVVVVGERSGALKLRSNASSLGLVSCPSLRINVRPVINWVPDIGVGTDRPERPVRFGSDIVVEELINRHTISILPNWRPEHPSVTKGRGKESKEEQSPEHILSPAKWSSFSFK